MTEQANVKSQPYRQGAPMKVRSPGDGRRWVASKDAHPVTRLAFEEDGARAFVAANPGWSVIADDDPRWLEYRPGLAAQD